MFKIQKILKESETFKNTENIDFLTGFNFFQIVQKVFPCIPGGCIRKE